MPNNKLAVFDLVCVRANKVIFGPISFQLQSGESVWVKGANGSGKSSLLRLLTGLSTPYSGDILWQGQPISQINIQYWQQFHYLGHLNGIKLGLTCVENICLMHRLAGNDHAMQPHTYEAVFSTLQLAAHQHKKARDLSAGQKRRLALAKFFLFPKPFWILDEPLTALDTHMQNLFFSHLEQHLQAKGLAIISSHHPIQQVTHSLRLSSC